MGKNIILVLALLALVVLSFLYIDLKKENRELEEILGKPYRSDVNVAVLKAEELMNELVNNTEAGVYMTSAYFSFRDDTQKEGYCISFKEWEGEKVCSSEINETLDKKQHEYLIKVLKGR